MSKLYLFKTYFWLSLLLLTVTGSTFADDLIPLYPKVVSKPIIDSSAPGMQNNPAFDPVWSFSHCDSTAEYYLGSGAADDTFFAVFEPIMSCSVLFAEIQWFSTGPYVGFAARYSEAAQDTFPFGIAPERGTTEISPIGEILGNFTADTAENVNEWTEFNIGAPFYVGDPVTHLGESFGVGYIKTSAEPKILADAVSQVGTYYSYSWFGGPWMPTHSYEHTWGAYSANYTGTVIEYMIRVWVSYSAGSGCADVILTPVNPPIILPLEGGSFDYNLTVINNHNYYVQWDIWTTITRPDCTVYGPIIELLYYWLPVPGISVNETQYIPPDWPAGVYTYNAYVGYQSYAIYQDHFQFTKILESTVNPISNECYPQNYDLNIYPNPFNQQLNLDFILLETMEIKLVVYDINGREVQVLGAGCWGLGKHSVVWDASGQASGVYFVRLVVDGKWSMVEKVALMK